VQLHAVPIVQSLASQCGAEVTVLLAHQLPHVLTNTVTQPIACGAAPSVVDQGCAAARLVPDQQTLSLS